MNALRLFPPKESQRRLSQSLRAGQIKELSPAGSTRRQSCALLQYSIPTTCLFLRSCGGELVSQFKILPRRSKCPLDALQPSRQPQLSIYHLFFVCVYRKRCLVLHVTPTQLALVFHWHLFSPLPCPSFLSQICPPHASPITPRKDPLTEKTPQAYAPPSPPWSSHHCKSSRYAPGTWARRSWAGWLRRALAFWWAGSARPVWAGRWGGCASKTVSIGDSGWVMEGPNGRVLEGRGGGGGLKGGGRRAVWLLETRLTGRCWGLQEGVDISSILFRSLGRKGISATFPYRSRKQRIRRLHGCVRRKLSLDNRSLAPREC